MYCGPELAKMIVWAPMQVKWLSRRLCTVEGFTPHLSRAAASDSIHVGYTRFWRALLLEPETVGSPANRVGHPNIMNFKG